MGTVSCILRFLRFEGRAHIPFWMSASSNPTTFIGLSQPGRGGETGEDVQYFRYHIRESHKATGEWTACSNVTAVWARSQPSTPSGGSSSCVKRSDFNKGNLLVSSADVGVTD